MQLHLDVGGRSVLLLNLELHAAAFLLRHRTAEAKAVLEEAAKGQGLVPFEARQTLRNWEEGTWALDLA